MNKKKTGGFEASLERLNEIVRILDAEETSLQESMTLYAEGIQIAEGCVKELTEAQTRIQELRKRSDGLFEQLDFDDE